jgi:hypothetical protein
MVDPASSLVACALSANRSPVNAARLLALDDRQLALLAAALVYAREKLAALDVDIAAAPAAPTPRAFKF